MTSRQRVSRLRIDEQEEGYPQRKYGKKSAGHCGHDGIGVVVTPHQITMEDHREHQDYHDTGGIVHARSHLNARLASQLRMTAFDEERMAPIIHQGQVWKDAHRRR